MSLRKDLDKNTLYNGVKTLIESDRPHLHLPQKKLYTLFSLAFQHMLFSASKNKGHYIIRVEDSYLAEKLARKAKDTTTRRFLGKMIVPRRLSYNGSTFHLDFFNIKSWGVTQNLAKEKIKGAIIVKNASVNPLMDEASLSFEEEALQMGLDKNYFLSSLISFVPQTTTIAFDCELPETQKIYFDFIEEKEELVGGVKLSANINLNDVD